MSKWRMPNGARASQAAFVAAKAPTVGHVRKSCRREIRAGEHGDDTGPGARCIDIDAADRGMGARRTEDDGMHHLRETQIGGEPPLADEKAAVLNSCDDRLDRIGHPVTS
jgi:hypothetical protein